MDPRGILKAFPKRKKIHADASSKVLAKIPRREEGEAAEEWLSSLRAHVVCTGIGRARAELFEKQIVQHGGQLCPAQAPGVTHIVVDDGMDYERALRLLRLPQLPQGAQLVKSAWLSLCLQERRLVDVAEFSIFIPSRYLDQPQPSKTEQDSSIPSGTHEALLQTALFPPPSPTRPVSPPQKAKETPNTQAQPISDDETSDGEETQVNAADLEALISGHYPTSIEGDCEPRLAPEVLDKWVCAQPSSQKVTNHNLHITEKLEVLAKAYSVQGDKWRALGYAKAINALKSFHKPVTSYQEACSIPGIGKRMAEKIREILESGHLRKLDHISESVPVLELFSNIWGAGSKTAQMWYQQGFRSLEEIRSQASLTTQQAIGLKHYDDFLERMPREEATEIEQTVQKAAQAFNPRLLCVACGSYRRGKVTCGDVDVLITHPDGRSHQGIFSRLLDSLRQQGFLTDDLVSQEENGQQQKYLGVCRLPGPGRRHRRLDIIVVPYNEFACALLYFTGSAHFNRSMRALAKTKGMSLSEHALSTAVVRNPQGCKVGPGRVLPTPTEKDVFRHLGLPYREPAERDW
uniref:DNA polymerase n=1 Tax=Aotus nancymaae TaxID=37293 RepID=A0A2K5CCB8_AOTNA|nr:DNA polymerase lambda isoform X1 [Aotus nancymaae]